MAMGRFRPANHAMITHGEYRPLLPRARQQRLDARIAFSTYSTPSGINHHDEPFMPIVSSEDIQQCIAQK